MNFKKIAAIGASALMLGLTAGTAAAANYPAPFVVGSTASVAVVYGTGTGVSQLDVVYAGNIQSDLSTSLGTSGTTEATISGEAASLADGTDYIYLNDELNENVGTITADDLPNVLADGTFTDDAGTNTDYEQTISVLGGGTFEFGDSDNDYVDPALMLVLTTTEATGLFNMTVTFDSAINFTADDSESETITLFGKTYTVGTATDANTLVLLGGSDITTINIGETKPITVGDESYSVTLGGISDATTSPQASITISGETKTFTEGQTKSFAGGDLDVFVKTIFRTGENSGHVEVQVGADKLTFESGSAVMSGSDDDDIEGTLVYMDAVTALSSLTIAVAAADNDVNDILPGESFTDPVFGSVKIDFASVVNGPVIDGEQDVSTTRKKLSVVSGGDRELQITATDASGNTQTVPFTYHNYTSDDASGNITLWEGQNISEDDYFILNSGTNQHFMQMTKIGTIGSHSVDVQFKDLFTGTSYNDKIDNYDFGTGPKTITIAGQDYTVTNLTADDAVVTITSSDYANNVAVYPYIELDPTQDHRFAITDSAAIAETLTATAVLGTDDSKIYELPTGTIQFRFTNGSVTWQYKIDSASSWSTNATNGADDTYTIGSVEYVIGATWTANVSLVIDDIEVEQTQGDADNKWSAPILLYMEDEDKAESTTTTENAVLIRTTDDAAFSEVMTPTLTSTNSDSATFDDTDFTGYIDTFGTYVLKDASDDDQTLISLTYPKNPMYADVYISESDAVISGGSSSTGALGNILVTDADVSSMSTKNLIIVGGSCINTVAANLLGGAYCGSGFTEQTDVGAGQYLIQSFTSPYTSGKIALLVAGYNVDDTQNAATYLTTGTGVKTDVGSKWVGTSSTSAELM